MGPRPDREVASAGRGGAGDAGPTRACPLTNLTDLRFLPSCAAQQSTRPGEGVDSLPDQAGYLLGARQQQWAGAEDQPIPAEFDRPLLVGPDPVGEQREFHMVDDAVAVKAVAARVGHIALHGPGLLLGGPAEQVAGGEPGPTPARDRDGKAAVGGVEQVAQGVGPHRIGDLAVSGSVLPGEQPPGPNERLATVHVAHGGLPNVIPYHLTPLAPPLAADRRQPPA